MTSRADQPPRRVHHPCLLLLLLLAREAVVGSRRCYSLRRAVLAMAVQAQYVAHAFLPHDPRAVRPALDNASVFLEELGGLAAAVQQQAGNTVFSDPRSELTCNHLHHNDSGCFVPRKRAWVGGDDGAAGLIMEGNRALPPQAFGDVQRSSRVVGSGAASTSAAPVSHGLLSHLYRQSVETDALVRFENERLRAGLEEARRRHVRSVVSAVERAASRRLRAAEAELERALGRNAELDEKLRQMGAEGQAWLGIAKSHEVVAAGLRATLDQLLQSPCAAEGEGDAEDAQSCCFVRADQADGGEASSGRKACKACGEADACVLLLPCRHLCLCRGCEAAADACPVCAATKNASLHVLLP